jgi:23S rRNA (guanosine2251-2'-O)-methyltransferase
MLNERRVVEKIYIVDSKKKEYFLALLKKSGSSVPFSKEAINRIEIVDPKVFQKLLFGESQGAHQGILLQVQPLPSFDIDLLDEIVSSVVLLDQVTDPQNIGNIIRSCAVFKIDLVILPRHNAPKESSFMAKAASGALDIVPISYVTNVSKTLSSLKEKGFWCIGLSEKAPKQLSYYDLKGKIVLVLGAEGDGMRRLTLEQCDMLAFLGDPSSDFSTLNVSNSGAIAFYEMNKQRG